MKFMRYSHVLEEEVTNAREISFVWFLLLTMACTIPTLQAACAPTVGFSRYMSIVSDFPATRGSARLSINRGFIPREMLPKLNTTS